MLTMKTTCATLNAQVKIPNYSEEISYKNAIKTSFYRKFTGFTQLTTLLYTVVSCIKAM